MIDFLYSQGYTVNESNTANPNHPTNTRTTNVLLQHVQVNAIADYYGITQLSDLATSNIRAVLQSQWSTSNFSTVVKETFSTTGDRPLQHMLALTASDHIEELLSSATFPNLEPLHGFAVSILREVLAKYQSRLKALDKEIQALTLLVTAKENEVKAIQARRHSDTTKVHRVIRNINHCISIVNRAALCGACNDDAGCYISRSGRMEEPTYIVRCIRCHYRYRE
ncbi:hypothetical protein ETB97_008865 [Aspergillus alliaceus]|uniref:Uncharacterized protein n=1 Tax=Petromyces alliaceus TaxID=209559 RepID=A0A8H6E2A9_PETAA|nr:hypothetical protein ETB97_008865 [Aspergillus burnettii]